MDDLAGLDRLDWWLNAQLRSRRLLLLWLDAYPLGFALCYALWACWAFKGVFGRAALAAGAVALLMAIPVVFVLSGRHALRVAEMRKRPGKAWARLCWRTIASHSLFASFMVIAFTVFADNQYGKPHPALLTARWLQTVICIGYFGLKFADDHYAKQVGRRRLSAQAHGSAVRRWARQRLPRSAQLAARFAAFCPTRTRYMFAGASAPEAGLRPRLPSPVDGKS